jgi:type IV secretion system protein VirD4
LTPSATSARAPAEHDDEGGLRREPELDAPDEVVRPLEVDELGRLDDGDEFETPEDFERFSPDRRLMRTARLASLDPDDGLAL